MVSLPQARRLVVIRPIREATMTIDLKLAPALFALLMVAV